MERQEDVDELELLTRPGREDELRTFLLLLHPADLAELVDDVTAETAKAILKHLDPERAANLLSELDAEEQERILRLVRPQDLAPIVGEMETDDVTDLLQEVDEKTAKALLATLPREEREEVARLLEYDPASAGGIMQTELVTVAISTTIGAAMKAVREAAKEVDIISVFVVDDVGRYAGHLALQDLVLSAPETPVEDVMEPKLAEVTPDVDQEEVARIFNRYSLVELGVVDRAERRLIGRITADDVHDVLMEEAEEDMLKIAGAGAEPEVIYTDKIRKILRRRLPWMGSTLVAGLVAAWVLARAAVHLKTAVILLAFVPMVTGASGIVGFQSAMIMIRGLAVGHIEKGKLAQHIFKDVAVASLMGLACGGAAAAIIALWQGVPLLGVCVGVALGCSMGAASLLGSCEPPILKRFGIDPAIAAGPLIASINDVLGVVVYMLVSLLILGQPS